MDSDEKNPLEEQGKLRRWVSNLQLESWQLELLITGFSIFLLATSLEEYDNFRRAVQFHKLSPGASTTSPLFVVSVSFLLDAIPLALRFFLINLLIHLLLRGFWIGIVGLSSVSSVIDFEGLKLKGRFNKYMPNKVKSLDELIVYLDKVSSVIFAYTYLLVFSIISVALVFVVIILLTGTIVYISTQVTGSTALSVLNMLLLVIMFLYALGALFFFVDTLTFSFFKRSKTWNPIYYPIYRIFSAISLSFLYRPIYYHLITNYKKKQVATIGACLLVIFLVSTQFNKWNVHTFFPVSYGTSAVVMENQFYDDVRGDNYIQAASIPSRYVKNGFMELFIRYNPRDNRVMRFLCPESESMDNTFTIMDGFRAGVQSQMDSTKSVEDFLPNADRNYGDVLANSAACLSEVFEIFIDGELVENPEFLFKIHHPKKEKGFLVVLDIEALERGRHTVRINHQVFTGILLMEDVSADKLKMSPLAEFHFWTP